MVRQYRHRSQNGFKKYSFFIYKLYMQVQIFTIKFREIFSKNTFYLYVKVYYLQQRVRDIFLPLALHNCSTMSSTSLGRMCMGHWCTMFCLTGSTTKRSCYARSRNNLFTYCFDQRSNAFELLFLDIVVPRIVAPLLVF